MKNTLWRFGDSWATTKDNIYFEIERNHSNYISDYFDMEFVQLAVGGFSNLQIFKTLIENSNKFQKNDIILINFASVSRIAIVEDFEISCVANGGSYDDVSKLMVNVIVNDMGKPISDILFYLIKSFIESLIDRGIRVYFFFLDERIELNLKNELIFKSSMGKGFIHWCIENGHQDLTENGNVHYTLGSQKIISNKIIELIESL